MARSAEGLERRRANDRRRAKAKNRAYYAKNKEQERARCKAYRTTNRDEVLAGKADWRARHRERENRKNVQRRRDNIDEYLAREKARREAGTDAASRKQWRDKNRSRIKERAARWAKDNRAKMREKNARRRCLKLRATPPWADHEAIRATYAECVEVSRRTGIPHEVDHIIPLKGKSVCGLHVPCNLQIIPKRMNRSKGNR